MIADKSPSVTFAGLTCLISFVIFCIPTNDASTKETQLEDIHFFETNIRPLLIDNCVACHKAGNAKSGLQLDSWEGVLRGGNRGNAVVPTKPEESLLLKAVSHQDENLKMPPGKKLDDKEIQLLAEWVQRGAPWTAKTAEPMREHFTQEDREFWLFQPVEEPEVPSVTDKGWSENPIDHFIYQKLTEAELQPAQPAEKHELIRRAYYDLTGLPPAPAEVDAFVNDSSPDAYEKLIDRLLASPHYGEKWARHWMDLARYAESDGYKADHYRPNAWRYRDYVIQSLNEDKPYNQFVMEQLAGDEIAPNDPEALLATHFLRLGIYEYNQRDARTQWDIILNDLTDVTGDMFLGMSVSCARCHDHKFDPVLQKDYYRLRAFFAPVHLRNDLPVVSSAAWQEHQAKLAVWKAKTEHIRKQIKAIETPHYEKGANAIRATFPEDVKAMVAKAPQERTPYEQQIAMLVEFQAIDKGNAAVGNIKKDEKEQLNKLYKQLKEYDQWKPKPLPTTWTARDVGPYPPNTFIPDDPKQETIEPGIFTILKPEPMEIETVPSAPNSTGRRTALARWITNPKNPITNRVIVNRLWQYHFGTGLVATSSEFGNLGEKPSHPQLLDWLTVRFVEDGWSLKKMHKLMMTSAAYRQSSKRPLQGLAKRVDPQNRLLWRFNARRLEAEEIRDSMLAVSGELDESRFGPSVNWSVPKRSVYTKVYRNKRDDVLDVFDVPDGISSTAARNVTTTPLQSLFLMNSGWIMKRANALMARMETTQPADLHDWVQTAFQTVLCRKATRQELDETVAFIRQHAQLIEKLYNRETERIAHSVREFVTHNLNHDERLDTLKLVQTKINEIAKEAAAKSGSEKSIALVGGEGGPKLKEIEEISGGDELSQSLPTQLSYAQKSALTDFCHILLNTSEFLYVE